MGQNVDQSDADLVKRTLEGDTKAFNVLVDRYTGPMYQTVCNLVRDPDLAQDITQEGFIKCWHKLDSYRDEFRFFSWLYRIMVNESLNSLRSMRPADPVGDHHRDNNDPQTIQISREENEELHQLIRQLPEDQRVVLQLRHFEELSYDEIAEILEIESGLVKSRLYSARMKLRDQLFQRKND